MASYKRAVFTNGKYIAFSVAGEVGSNVWVYESLVKEVKQITQEEQGRHPVWPIAP